MTENNVECRIVLSGSKLVSLTTNGDIREKLVLTNQVSLCEFQREFKFGIEEKIGNKNTEYAL